MEDISFCLFLSPSHSPFRRNKCIKEPISKETENEVNACFLCAVILSDSEQLHLSSRILRRVFALKIGRHVHFLQVKDFTLFMSFLQRVEEVLPSPLYGLETQPTKIKKPGKVAQPGRGTLRLQCHFLWLQRPSEGNFLPRRLPRRDFKLQLGGTSNRRDSVHKD